MLRIDLLRESDLPAALRLSTQAGWNQIDADWRRLLALWPDTCLAGRLNDQLVATATLATYGDVGWVGMVLVDESHRRRGFGGQMFNAILKLGRARGVRSFGLDATELGRPVYLRHRFVDAVGIDRWERRASPGWHGKVPLPASCSSTPRASVLAHATQRAMENTDLDHRSSGVDRRRLLTCLAAERDVQAFAIEGEAFAVLRRGRTAAHLGPVVARDEDRAEAVLSAALARGAGDGVIIDVPRGRLASFLPRHGFEPVRRLVRMQTADTPAPLLAGPGVFAACGFELG
jgi:GNAT superfamily N-acetyltransferase